MRLNRKTRIGAASLAIALLLIGFVSIWRSLNRSNPSPPDATGNRVVGDNRASVSPVAAQRVAWVREDLPARSIVTLDMLEMRDAPVNAENDVYVSDVESQAVGFVTQRAINAGTRLRRDDLVGHISAVGIAGALQPGTRAMILPIVGKNTLHDLVRIGDRVDVVASFDQQESRTVVQDVRVLAVDVFGKDYPQVKVAMRGDYKAAQRNIGTANPASPEGGAAPAGSNPDAPQGQGQAPPAPGANRPEATPTTGAPATRPDPALTLEVTPQQATAISLTQAAGQNLDFLIRPRSEPTILAGAVGSAQGATTANAGNVANARGDGSAQFASTTRDRLAPYSTRLKRAGNTPSNGAGSNSNSNRTRLANTGNDGGSRSSRINRDPLPMPDFPDPAAGRQVPPLSPAELGGRTTPVGDAPARDVAPPATYQVPVYGDGQLVRVETVKKPLE